MKYLVKIRHKNGIALKYGQMKLEHLSKDGKIVLIESESRLIQDKAWIYDTGETCHMVGNEIRFTLLRKLAEHIVSSTAKN
jgi:hypothetical protein